MAGSPGAFPREIHHALDQQALLLRSGRKREETVGDWAWKEISRAQTDPRDLQWPENRVRPLVVACSSPQIHAALSLVKARLKGKVCYLITHERVQTEEQAWEIFVSYNRCWQIEIVQSQLTKTKVLAGRGSGDHIADLHLLIGDHNAVNQQLNQLPFLLKGGLSQALLHALAKGFDRLDLSRQLIVAPHARL